MQGLSPFLRSLQHFVYCGSSCRNDSQAFDDGPMGAPAPLQWGSSLEQQPPAAKKGPTAAGITKKKGGMEPGVGLAAAHTCSAEGSSGNLACSSYGVVLLMECMLAHRYVPLSLLSSSFAFSNFMQGMPYLNVLMCCSACCVGSISCSASPAGGQGEQCGGHA